MEKDITILKSLIEDLKREEKLIGYDAEYEIQALENLIKGYRELEKRNKKLKATHIMTHNKVSDEEKAKLFDVIDNSIDTYLEKTEYIPKSKVKEKIEELKNIRWIDLAQEVEEEHHSLEYMRAYRAGKENALQELLGDEE